MPAAVTGASARGPRSQFPQEEHNVGDDAVVFFTDGLIERRDRDFDEGLKLLLEAAEQSPRSDADSLLDGLTSRLVADEPRSDDVAILAVQRTARPTTD